MAGKNGKNKSKVWFELTLINPEGTYKTLKTSDPVKGRSIWMEGAEKREAARVEFRKNELAAQISSFELQLASATKPADRESFASRIEGAKRKQAELVAFYG